MKRFFQIETLFLAAALFLAGCGLLPSAKSKAARVDASEQKAKAAVARADESVVRSARGYVAGTGEALSKAADSPAVSVAREFNSRAQSALGAPTIDELAEVRKIVAGLLDDNAKVRAEAARKLDARDAELASVLRDREELREKIVAAEARKTKLLYRFADAADKWSTLESVFWVGVAVLVFATVLPVVIRVVAPLLGPFGPLAGLLSAAVGHFVRAVADSVPGAVTKARLVTQEAHEALETAARHVVTAINTAKQDPATKAVLKPILLATTDDASRQTITKLGGT